MNITINNPYASFTCTTKGAELISYTDQDGHQYIWQKNDQYWDKVSPILFPYIGSDIDFINYGTESYPMLHLGLIKDMDFQITKKGAHSVTLSTMSNEETKQYYPYDFEFSVTFRLRETELEISYTVSNLNKSDMPFLIGGHTNFLCPMEADEKLEEYCLSFADTDKEDIPLTHQMFDSGTNLYDQFTERKVKLHKNFEHGVVFQFPDFPQLGLWSPPKKNAPFICFQPWCAGTVDELSQKDIAKRKYVQILSSHQSKMYRFSFTPLQKEEIEEDIEATIEENMEDIEDMEIVIPKFDDIKPSGANSDSESTVDAKPNRDVDTTSSNNTENKENGIKKKKKASSKPNYNKKKKKRKMRKKKKG